MSSVFCEVKEHSTSRICGGDSRSARKGQHCCLFKSVNQSARGNSKQSKRILPNIQVTFISLFLCTSSLHSFLSLLYLLLFSLPIFFFLYFFKLTDTHTVQTAYVLSRNARWNRGNSKPKVQYFFPLIKPVYLQYRKSENVSVLVIMDP